MDGNSCDRHSSARAAARVLLPTLNDLYLCGHCLKAFERTYQGEFHISYEMVNLEAS